MVSESSRVTSSVGGNGGGPQQEGKERHPRQRGEQQASLIKPAVQKELLLRFENAATSYSTAAARNSGLYVLRSRGDPLHAHRNSVAREGG
ncbi:unnamed protein product [Rangifer tarandus platyrhynchus]|uniref:Uncharacterized protein n=1 Tax=Rangifer tarandus platyrhynchus TaxID=3082113 RepID=A0ACB1KEI4_RANTA